MELVGGYYVELYSQESMMYAIAATIEEFLEMLGILVFVYALLSYIDSYMKGLSIQVTLISDRHQHRSA